MSEINNQPSGLTASNRRLVMIAGIIAGIILLVIALVYFMNPANGLPVFFPGYNPALASHHWKHGLLALILGVGALVVAWFNSGSAQKK